MSDEKDTAVQMVPAARVRRADVVVNHRRTFDEGLLRELSTSIEKNGLIEPIIVRPVDDHYEIVAGERRWRAMTQFLEWEELPCIVRSMTDEEASSIMAAENISRVDLNPIERAEAFQLCMDEYGWDVDEVADRAGCSAGSVKRALRLNDLVPEAKDLVASGQIAVSEDPRSTRKHGDLLTSLNETKQRLALKMLVDRDVTVRVFRRYVKELRASEIDSLFDLQEDWLTRVDDGDMWVPTGSECPLQAPDRDDLPNPRLTVGSHMGEILHHYVIDLQEAGLHEEAAVVGHLYNALLDRCWIRFDVQPAREFMDEPAYN